MHCFVENLAGFLVILSQESGTFMRHSVYITPLRGWSNMYTKRHENITYQQQF